MSRTLPAASLGRRFALAAAALAAGALLVTALGAWWFLERQRDSALRALAQREIELHAAAESSDLSAVVLRMREIARSTLLASGLVDSAGRETYIVPFLAGVRQVNAIPIHLIFTDFEGAEIANNGAARFGPAEMAWFRRALEAGRPAATILGEGEEGHVLAMEPLVYSRTQSPEGALLYKFALADLRVASPMRIAWGADPAEAGERVEAIPVPPLLEPLGLRLVGPAFTAVRLEDRGGQLLAIIGLSLLVFLGVSFIGLRVARHLTADLSRLEAFSRSVADGATIGRAPETGSAEVASLARSINHMLERLQQQHRSLLQERQKLSELADALQEADRRKDEFIATLSHELRNPLAPIRNSMYLLRHGAGKTLDDGILDMMERQLNVLVRLVDDLLEMSRISRGAIELREEVLDVAAVVRNAVDTSMPLIRAGKHHLEVSLPAQPTFVRGDPVRLAQIVTNILNNAAVYTDPGGRIEIRADMRGGLAAIVVRDNGSGIEGETLSRLFGMFHRGAASGERAPAGLGIGLALSQRLAQMHGGRIEARSEGAGRGSEFTLLLPRVEAPHQALPPPSDASEGLDGRRILVVDDNVDAAESLSMVLQSMGAEVRSVSSGSRALEAMTLFAPDVVLLDIGMPEMDGYEVARRIRARDRDGPRLIALTGWGQDDDREKARAAGFDHHLVKPVAIDELKRALEPCTA